MQISQEELYKHNFELKFKLQKYAAIMYLYKVKKIPHGRRASRDLEKSTRSTWNDKR